jgi:hypothetical protein
MTHPQDRILEGELFFLHAGVLSGKNDEKTQSHPSQSLLGPSGHAILGMPKHSSDILR